MRRIVVEVLTDSVDVKQYIKKMRKRDPELDARWGYNLYPHSNAGNGLTDEWDRAGVKEEPRRRMMYDG